MRIRHGDLTKLPDRMPGPGWRCPIIEDRMVHVKSDVTVRGPVVEFVRPCEPFRIDSPLLGQLIQGLRLIVLKRRRLPHAGPEPTVGPLLEQDLLFTVH